jgi:hypothetical protein
MGIATKRTDTQSAISGVYWADPTELPEQASQPVVAGLAPLAVAPKQLAAKAIENKGSPTNSNSNRLTSWHGSARAALVSLLASDTLQQTQPQ